MSTQSVNYFQLLNRNRDFTKLWVGQLVSNLGDWFNNIAVLALVFDLTQSGLATGLIIIASTLPAFILTPFAGSVADRFDRRKIMIVSDLAQAVLALGMLLVRSAGQIWLLYIFSGLLVAFASFFGPALSAAIPNLVEKDELISANALSSSTWGLMLAVGAAVGGIVIAAMGRDAAFVVNSFSFVVSAGMIFWVRKPFGRAHAGYGHQAGLSSSLHEFGDGLAFLREHPQVVASILVKTGMGLSAGIILLLTVFSQAIFRAGDSGIGWLYSARGLGVLLGPYLVRPLVGNRLGKMRNVIFGSFIVASLSYLGYSGSPFFWLAALFVVFAHIGTGTLWVLSSTMLQMLVPDRLLGRIFAIDFGLNTVTGALSTFLVGVALQWWDARPVAAAMGLVFVAYAFLWGGMVFFAQRSDSEAWSEKANLRETETG